MSGTFIDASFIFDDSAVTAGLLDKSRSMADPRPVLDIIGLYMEGETIKNFDAGGRPHPWKPLSLATMLTKAGTRTRGFVSAGSAGRSGATMYRKAAGSRSWRSAFKQSALKKGEFSSSGLKKSALKKIGKNQVLVDSGRLKGSVHHSTRTDSVQWGSNVVYAAIHQYGGRAGRGRKVYIPARPYIVILPEHQVAIKKILEQWFAGDFD